MATQTASKQRRRERLTRLGIPDPRAANGQVARVNGKGKDKRRQSSGASEAAAFTNLDSDEEQEFLPEEADDDNVQMRDVGEKDEGELELEKMLFGDSEGFREKIRTFGQERASLLEDERAEDGEDSGLAGMRDQDLFFMDTTGTEAGPLSMTGLDEDGAAYLSDDSADSLRVSGRQPAWQDSDDERISVSLASVPRLRKLRTTADEDVVNGKTYIRRLRKQFTLLNPTPDWVRDARQGPPAKKRRLSGASSASSDITSGDEDADTDLSVAPLSALLRSTASLTKTSSSGTKKTRKLRPETIDIQRVADIAPTQPSAISSISFHPSLPLLLTSGPSGTLYLHHIAPSAVPPNPLLTSLHLRSTPLSTTLFHPTTDRILLSARRRYFHIWSLTTGRIEKITRFPGFAADQRSAEHLRPSPCGRFLALRGTGKKGGGTVNILSASSMQWKCTVRVDALQGVADYAWWSDGRGLSVAAKSGEITEYDVQAERVVGRWLDEGAVGTTTLTLGGDAGVSGDKGALIGPDRWVVVGSQSGVVNIYDRREWYAAYFRAKHDGPKRDEADDVSPVVRNPKPTRVLDHLTTPVSVVALSPDAQCLAIASRWKKDALRLVHLPSCTVYRNWPTKATPLGRVTGLAFGWIGGTQQQQQQQEDASGADAERTLALSVGNEAGKVRLWEIRY